MNTENERKGCLTPIEALLAMVLIVLVAAIGVFLLFRWQSNQQAATSSGNDAAPGEQRGEETGALRAYELAKAEMQSWASDAVLIRATGTWPNQEFTPQLNDWAFIFYSPTRYETASITVVDSSAGRISTRPAQEPPATVPAEAWVVDSSIIVKAFLENAGGDLFIESYEDVSMVLTLDNDQQMMWTARLVDWSGGNVFSRQFDATTGKLVAAP